MADLTAIIPTHGRQELLSSLLSGLAAQTRPPSEILVIDNASPDDSPALARAAGARVIEMGTNTGFSRAVNTGIAAASTELVAVLNNDIVLDASWTERLVAELETTNAWFAVGKIHRHDQPKILDGSFDLVARSGCAWRCGEGNSDSPLWNKPADVFFPPFTAAVFRASLFEKIGPLDERFESYYEDVDFGIRCALAGCLGRYVPAATARHIGSATLGTWNAAKVRLMARNQLLLVAKHYPRRGWGRLAWPVAAGQLLWGFVAMRHAALFPYLQGKLDGLRHFGTWRRAADPDAALHDILCESERTIEQFQSAAGFDRYWRWYFRLT